MERLGRSLRSLAHKFHGEREVTTWPADWEGQRLTKPHSESSACQNCGGVEVDLALSILIPDSRWSETEKAKVSKPIGKGISFFPSPSHFVRVPLTCSSHFPTQQSEEKKEHCRWSRRRPAAPAKDITCLAELCEVSWVLWSHENLCSSKRSDPLPVSILLSKTYVFPHSNAVNSQKLPCRFLKSQAEVLATPTLGSFLLEMLNLTWFDLYLFHLGKRIKAKK